jgi:hypothetical protein
MPDRVLSGKVGAGGDDRVAQFLDDGKADRIVRHPDADGSLLGQEQVGNHRICFHDEGVRPGKQAAQQFEGVVTHLRVARDLGQVGADEGKRLLPVALLDGIDALDAFFGKDAAADTVGGVRRIGDNATVLEGFHDLGDQSWLRIFGVYLQ